MTWTSNILTANETPQLPWILRRWAGVFLRDNFWNHAIQWILDGGVDFNTGFAYIGKGKTANRNFSFFWRMHHANEWFGSSELDKDHDKLLNMDAILVGGTMFVHAYHARWDEGPPVWVRKNNMYFIGPLDSLPLQKVSWDNFRSEFAQKLIDAGKVSERRIKAMWHSRNAVTASPYILATLCAVGVYVCSILPDQQSGESDSTWSKPETSPASLTISWS